MAECTRGDDKIWTKDGKCLGLEALSSACLQLSRNKTSGNWGQSEFVPGYVCCSSYGAFVCYGARSCALGFHA